MHSALTVYPTIVITTAAGNKPAFHDSESERIVLRNVCSGDEIVFFVTVLRHMAVNNFFDLYKKHGPMIIIHHHTMAVYMNGRGQRHYLRVPLSENIYRAHGRRYNMTAITLLLYMNRYMTHNVFYALVDKATNGRLCDIIGNVGQIFIGGNHATS